MLPVPAGWDADIKQQESLQREASIGQVWLVAQMFARVCLPALSELALSELFFFS